MKQAVILGVMGVWAALATGCGASAKPTTPSSPTDAALSLRVDEGSGRVLLGTASARRVAMVADGSRD